MLNPKLMTQTSDLHFVTHTGRLVDCRTGNREKILKSDLERGIRGGYNGISLFR